MKYRKFALNVLLALLLLTGGIYASKVFLDATAQTQAQREASFIAKADSTRVGQSVKLGNGSFLKISEINHE